MNDAFYLTEDQRLIRDLARTIARERVAPHAARYDDAEEYPEDSIRALIDAGLYGIWVPERYGGTDAGCLALALVCEEIAWACAATATQYLDQPLGGLPILRFGTEAQKTKYLPRLATGELLAAYSLSELAWRRASSSPRTRSRSPAPARTRRASGRPRCGGVTATS